MALDANTVRSSQALIDILEDGGGFPTIIACISQQSSPQSLEVSLKILSNLLAEKPALVRSHLGEVVTAMSNLLGEGTASSGTLSSRQLTILCDICELVGSDLESVEVRSCLERSDELTKTRAF